MSELNKVFDAPTREAKRKILDNYPISADDKNKFLNKVGSGGSGGSGESSTIEYLDLANANSSIISDYWTLSFIALSLYCKVNDGGNVYITPSGTVMCENPNFGVPWYYVTAVAIDFNSTAYFNGQIATVKDILSEFSYTDDELNLIPRITKEEFYSLEQ